MSKVLQSRLEILEGSPTDFISVGSALAMNANDHGNRTMKLDTATGSVATLPPATGSGKVYNFVVSVLATSNSHIIKASRAADSMQGIILSLDDTGANAVGFAAVAGTSDTITLNRTTTGSVTIGETIRVTDFASGRFHVEGVVSNSGTPATQFSATVS